MSFLTEIETNLLLKTICVYFIAVHLFSHTIKCNTLTLHRGENHVLVSGLQSTQLLFCLQFVKFGM